MNGRPALHLEPVDDPAWLTRFIVDHWGEPGVVSRGRLWTAESLSALRIADDAGLAGVVSWRPDGSEWELVTLDSLRRFNGFGTALVGAVVERARATGVRRLWLVTTNDNLDALRFYQRRGWRMTKVWPDAVGESRKIKPSIPETGAYGIAIRDEIELEYRFA